LLISGTKVHARTLNRDDEANTAVVDDAEASDDESGTAVDLVRLDSDFHKAMEAMTMMAANLRAYLLSRR
jgi:hypothetical protein